MKKISSVEDINKIVKNEEIEENSISSNNIKGCKVGFTITNEILELDKLKSKVFKYITYKKRTANEVRKKFENENQDLLEEIIEYFKSQNYINEEDYIERSINEFIALKSLSIKEIAYKLTAKGVEKKLLDKYICDNKEKLLEFEINSAKKIIKKNSGKKELEDIKKYLYQKGYMSESISIAMEELEDAVNNF